MAQQAQDTFVGVLSDGTERLVTRGEVLPDSHELVKRAALADSGLFRALNVDGGEVPAIKPRAPQAAPQPDPPPQPPRTAAKTAAPKGKAGS